MVHFSIEAFMQMFVEGLWFFLMRAFSLFSLFHSLCPPTQSGPRCNGKFMAVRVFRLHGCVGRLLCHESHPRCLERVSKLESVCCVLCHLRIRSVMSVFLQKHVYLDVVWHILFSFGFLNLKSQGEAIKNTAHFFLFFLTLFSALCTESFPRRERRPSRGVTSRSSGARSRWRRTSMATWTGWPRLKTSAPSWRMVPGDPTPPDNRSRWKWASTRATPSSWGCSRAPCSLYSKCWKVEQFDPTLACL